MAAALASSSFRTVTRRGMPMTVSNTAKYGPVNAMTWASVIFCLLLCDAVASSVHSRVILLSLGTLLRNPIPYFLLLCIGEALGINHAIVRLVQGGNQLIQLEVDG